MIALLGAVLFALLVIGLFNGGEANGNEVVPEVSPADTPRAGLLALLLVEAGLGAYVPAPSPTPAPTTSPAPSPEPTLAPAYVPPVYVAPAGGLLCYRPDLVSCATESAIASRESTYGVNLYNPTPVWIGGVPHNAIGWFGMLYPLHATNHGLVPGGGLASDTAAFYSLITEQGLGPWY